MEKAKRFEDLWIWQHARERSTDAEFARFLDMAKGSCGEVRSLYHTAEDLDYVDAITALTSHLRQ